MQLTHKGYSEGFLKGSMLFFVNRYYHLGFRVALLFHSATLHWSLCHPALQLLHLQNNEGTW